MKTPEIRNLFTGLGLALLLAYFPADGQTIDFETPAYIAEKTIVGVDGWTMLGNPSSETQNNFIIQTASKKKSQHSLTKGTTSISRNFPDHLGGLDLRWRWRTTEKDVGLCLRVSGNSTESEMASRVQVCIDPSGKFYGFGLQTTTSTVSCVPQTWYYMRLRIDDAANTYILYISTDSSRKSEITAIPISLMNTVGEVSNVVLKGQGGIGAVDIDDISFENLSLWRGEKDGTWSNGNNWSTGKVPGKFTNVLFDETSGKTCFVDKLSMVKSISMPAVWKGTLNLGTSQLNIFGNADFTGGTLAYLPTAVLHFSSDAAQSLQSPDTSHTPPIIHDGTGTLRLDTRPLSAKHLSQLEGSLDLNGQDIKITDSFIIKNGKPGTLQNLDGRAISVGKSAHLEGISKDTMLGLVSTPIVGQTLKGWRITVPDSDTLSAKFASIGNSTASGPVGYALQSNDGGKNTGWNFVAPPAILKEPRDTLVNVGQNATFKISVSSKLVVDYQWFSKDKLILGAKDSIYTLLAAKRSDSASLFSCHVTSPGGGFTSTAAKLSVVFPTPTTLPLPKLFTDSLSVKLSTSISGAKIYYSRNGSRFLEFQGDIMLKDSTSLKAFAVLGPDSSAVATWIYPKFLLPMAETPIISPDLTTPFQESQVVSITAPTPGSAIFYTLDQSDPDSSKILYTTPFTLHVTTTVRARAFKANYRPSTIRTILFRRQSVDTTTTLPKPQALPPGGTFPDSVVVTMSPPASTPDAILYYSFAMEGLLKYSSPITLRTSGILKIIAIKGSVFSDTLFYTFSRQLPAPTANPKAKIFHDSLLISLTSATQGAAIRYTWDGSAPTEASLLYPGVPILLDSTATLKAVAFKGTNFSAIMSESYTLIADTVRASYGSGDYASKIQILLQTSTSRALIYYSLDGSTPGPESGSQPYTSPFWLNTTATLKAVAITGRGSLIQRSPMLVKNYSFISPGQKTIVAGQKLDLSSNYSLKSILPGAATVTVDILLTDSLSSLKGFRDIQFAIRLSLPQGSTAFPSIVFTAPNGEPRALYSLVGSSTVNYITDADVNTMVNPGTYFLAVDTLAPQIILSSESFEAEDSTKAQFTIQDNVSNLLLDLTRSDSPAQNLTAELISSPIIMKVVMRNPAGSILPLSIKLMVDDHHQKTAYPPEPGAYHFLSQKSSGPIRTPAVFQIGNKADSPWDLIAMPLQLDPPLTLAQIRKNNTAPGLEAAVWDTPTLKYRYLEDTAVLKPGTSVWMAATSSMPSLVFPVLKTQPYQEKGSYKIVLHKGWNQVANPTLFNLFWPVTRAIPGVYDQSPLKGLNGYNAFTQVYFHSDSLLPWRGYFAYYSGGRDTTINLSFNRILPVAVKANAAKAAAVEGISLTLGLSSVPALRLGAMARAQDGMGLEDEARPPVQGSQGDWLWSTQNKSHLETDLRHWTPGALYTWQVVARVSTESSLSGIQDPVLPSGYAAWAVSRTRGLRFPLQKGASIPMYPGLVDTFEVWAGPAAELESRLSRVPLTVHAFQLQISTTPGSFALHLQLPEAALVHWTLWGLDGRVCETSRRNLPEGVYRLTPNAAKSALTRGMYVLSLEWASRTGTAQAGSQGRLSRKIVIP